MEKTCMRNPESSALSHREREEILEGRTVYGSYTAKTCANYREAQHPGDNLRPDGTPWIVYHICLDPEVVARRGLPTLKEYSDAVYSSDGWPSIFMERPDAALINHRECNTCRYNTAFQRDFGDSHGK